MVALVQLVHLVLTEGSQEEVTLVCQHSLSGLQEDGGGMGVGWLAKVVAVMIMIIQKLGGNNKALGERMWARLRLVCSVRWCPRLWRSLWSSLKTRRRRFLKFKVPQSHQGLHALRGRFNKGRWHWWKICLWREVSLILFILNDFSGSFNFHKIETLFSIFVFSLY